MRNLIMICIMTLSIVGVSQAQETESGVLGNKANKALKLVKKGDLRGAINIFTDILKEDPSQKDVLLLRARTKYTAGAYQGALNDCFAYMEKHGIDDEVAGLLGKTQLAKGDYKQALAYLKVALLFNPSGEEYLLDRGQAYFDLGLDQEACNDWYDAAIAGSIKGAKLSEKYCRNFKKSNNKPEKETTTENNESDTGSQNSDTASNDSSTSSDTNNQGNDSNEDVVNNNDRPKKDVPKDTGNNSSSTDNSSNNTNSNNTNSNDNSDSGSDILVDDTSYENDYPIDTKINKIYIDEDLTIRIADGIGSREVKEMPDMLILSDYNGEVVVDVCINRIGKVVKSQLNESKSTIKTRSLVSLALRKSEEFWFDRTDRKEQCGTITFVIRAGNE